MRAAPCAPRRGTGHRHIARLFQRSFDFLFRGLGWLQVQFPGHQRLPERYVVRLRPAVWQTCPFPLREDAKSDFATYTRGPHPSNKTNKYITRSLEAKGGAKASAPEWESGGQRGRKKHGALFGGRGEESFICGSLPGSSCERRERRETERRETERRERERGERDERDEKEMREMREMRETVRQ